MDHFINIYSNHADQYHEMIAVEDVDGSLLPALENVTGLTGKHVLDLGSGTGRIPLLIHERATQVVGLELHWDMLSEQSEQCKARNGDWGLTQGDMRFLPFRNGSFDFVTAGWAIGHFTGWYSEDWQTQVRLVLEEMQRVAAPGGALIILETLTTGSLTPKPPSPGLAAYYTWLENEWGFTRQEIPTDYLFPNLEEAARYAEFFFGSDLADQVRANNWVRLPEWTGVWGKVLP
ncbi:MAG: class I SAM-dependent methyltransferase [Anaerolineales bacterium]|nr:class I SAM-dependent methyltransferase [Anaerolineales bacterium]